MKHYLFWFFPLLIAMPIQAQSAEQESGALITTAQSEPTDAENKPDRSLIPGLQAEVKAALDEAASARDSAAAAKKELDQRMSESNHWKDEIASVDKDRDAYSKKVDEYGKEVARHNALATTHIAKCPNIVTTDEQLISFCRADSAQLNQWKQNLDAEQDRLKQASADLGTRYTNIKNMIKNLNDRITTLSNDRMNAVLKYNNAIKRVDDLHKQLQQY